MTLLLVPTSLERDHLVRLGAAPREDLALVGFGPVAAAARASQLFAAARPESALLLGIAGALDPELETGVALTFGAVRLDGVGAGEGADHLLPSRMGLAQWTDGTGDVHEELDLAGDGPPLLTVCAASATSQAASQRRARHPGAAAEDMEAFGVALAARLHGVELSVVRGISNRAGERDVADWRIEEALAAAGTLARELTGRSPA